MTGGETEVVVDLFIGGADLGNGDSGALGGATGVHVVVVGDDGHLGAETTVHVAVGRAILPSLHRVQDGIAQSKRRHLIANFETALVGLASLAFAGGEE